MKENILLLSACDSLNQKVLSESLSVQTRVFRARVLRVFRSTLRSARVCGRKSASFCSSFGKDSKIFCDETLTTTRVTFFSRRKQKRRRKKEGRIKTDVYTFSISLSFARSRNQRPRTCLFCLCLDIIVYFETIFLSRCENLFTLYLAQSHIYT